MIKKKLESLSGGNFSMFKVSALINENGGGPKGGPMALQIPISGKGTHNGSGYSYSGEISTCTGSGTTSIDIKGFGVSNTKEYMYDCDWWAQVTYDGYTKTFHGP